METTRYDSLKLNMREHRLVHFGLESVKPESQAEAQKNEPKENTDTPKPTEKSKERTKKLKEAEAKDSEKDRKELKDIEKKMTAPDKKELTTKIEKALKNLEGTDPRFQKEFQQALEGVGVKNLMVEVTDRHRGGGIVNLKDKESGKVIVAFLATNDGTADHMEWKEQDEKTKTPEDREAERKGKYDKWMDEIIKDLGQLDGVKIELGEAQERIRTPADQYGIYVNGKYVGPVSAGYERGRAVNDASKYNRQSPPEIFFEKKGLKVQVEEWEKEIRAQAEK